MSAGPIQVSQRPPSVVPEDLANLGVEPQLIPFVVSTISRIEQSPNRSPPLNAAEVGKLVDVLDKVVSSPTVNSRLKDRCFKVLREVSPAHGVLPKSYFPPGVTLTDTIAYTSGGFAEVWRGQQGGNQVCVKAFRIQTVGDPGRIRRRFYREVVKWKYVSHPNVLPFLGISEELFPFCVVSLWLRNGNIAEYIEKHPGINRLQLLAQAACGLEHLHSDNVVHGNITPGNILITEEGTACLGDFGITTIITDPAVVERDGTATSKPGVTRYMAPELLNPPQFNLTHSSPSKESDVYSFAMTAYEVLTGVPSYDVGQEGILALSIVSGNRPLRPSTPTAGLWLSDNVWDAIQRCWAQTPQSRLPINSLHQELAQPEKEQKRGTLTTENRKDTATTDASGTVVASLKSPSLEGKDLARRARLPTPRWRYGVIRNPFKKVLAGIRQLVKRVFHC